MTAFIAELIGTFFLILLGNGVVANVLLKNTKGKHDQNWMVITTAWGLAVFIGVTIAGPYSGAHLNPAVTLGLALAGKFSPAEIPSYILAQFLGAALGALFVYLFYYPHYKITENDGLKRATFCTEPAIYHPFSNLFSEAIGAFALVFSVLFFTMPELKISGQETELFGLGSIGALPVALLVWVIGLSLGGTTGYAINPARDLAPRIVHQILPISGGSNWSYSWIPVVGPLIGATVAALLFLAVS